MTINEAIGTVDLLRPNSYTEDEKKAWLRRLEKRIEKEIIETHEDGFLYGDINLDGKVDMEDVELGRLITGKLITPTEEQTKRGDVDGCGKITLIDVNIIHKYIEGVFDVFPVQEESGKLCVPSPYDELYLFWLEAQIDYQNGEIQKYNNSITAFNHAYSAFERYYNRTHMPKKVVRKYF